MMHMLDIKLIRENPELVEENLKRRGDTEKIKLLHELVTADRERRKIMTETDELRRRRNEMTGKISKEKAEGHDVSDLVLGSKQLADQIRINDGSLEELTSKVNSLLLRIPNLLDKSVPQGKDESENREVRRWGEREWDFKPKDHIELCEKLGLLDSERGAKIAGRGFHFLKNELVVLDMSLQRFAIDFLKESGFSIVEPPFMMNRKPYEGVVDLGDFDDVLYKAEGEDLQMIATSEHPMAAMFMDETLLEKDLPIKLAGISPCFRREVGTHGKYTKGLFRMHHFNKIEQFIFSNPKDSWKIFEEIQKNAEDLVQALEIPYQVVNVCSGDIGSIASKKYDINFLMADGNYRELGSNSNCTDYQARRLNIKFREKEGAAPSGFVHTLNNTGLATSRAMIAIIENGQRSDGTIDIPKALWKYTGFKRIG